jgi:hypothetical protein
MIAHVCLLYFREFHYLKWGWLNEPFLYYLSSIRTTTMAMKKKRKLTSALHSNPSSLEENCILLFFSFFGCIKKCISSLQCTEKKYLSSSRWNCSLNLQNLALFWYHCIALLLTLKLKKEQLPIDTSCSCSASLSSSISILETGLNLSHCLLLLPYILQGSA